MSEHSESENADDPSSLGTGALPAPGGHSVSAAAGAYLRKRLGELLDSGGPRPEDSPELDRAVTLAWNTIRRDRRSVERLRSVFPKDFLRETLHGHAASKPMGYPGDFLLIDKIYTHTLTALTPFRRWDEFFQDHGAARAVRNRKEYFKRLLDDLRPRTVLNLGTGPGRDLAEYLSEHPTRDMLVTSVDQDHHANTYARRLLGRADDRAFFLTENLLRFRPLGEWDLVWCSGFFDYLDDRLFVRMLRRLALHVRSGGEVVLGNFSPANPTRPYMELMGDWCLQHRSADELMALGLRAGFEANQIHVGREPLGLNLFLHARRDLPHDRWRRDRGLESPSTNGSRSAA